MLQREIQLLTWLRHPCGLTHFNFAIASEDASFRRYFRIYRPGQASLIVMDAPPEHENCTPFVAMTARLHATGVHVPSILAQDVSQGFLLLEDLGDQVYLSQLTDENADALYGEAMQALLRFQVAGTTVGLLKYNETLLLQEMQLFIDWFVQPYLGLTLNRQEQQMLQACFRLLVQNALAQPQVLVHRDYHARNLLVCDDHSPGIIDYQDAVLGPITYDLVSLLRDSYISWPMHRVDTWLAHYTAQAMAQGILTAAQGTHIPGWFDLMGVQRQLKVAGIFARLHLRDGKSGYLADIPQTLRYIVEVAQRRSALSPLADFIMQRVNQPLDLII